MGLGWKQNESSRSAEAELFVRVKGPIGKYESTAYYMNHTAAERTCRSET